MEEQTNNAQNPQQANAGDAKVVALLSYITLIGWIVAVVMNGSEKKSDLGTYHIRQSLGLMITVLAISILQGILVFIPFIGWGIALVLNFGYLGVMVFWVLGLIAAINAEMKPLPLVGELFQKWFSFIK